MLYNVAQLLKDPIGSTRVYDLDERLNAPDEEWGSCQVRGKVKLLRTHRGVLVSADLQTDIAQTCGWCLEPFDLPLELTVEEEFFPQIDINTGLPVGVPVDTEPFLIDKHHILDISEAVRQAIVLTTPISPRCREECLGLCPTCGVNRNEQDCSCERVTDQRWASLGHLIADSGASDRI